MKCSSAFQCFLFAVLFFHIFFFPSQLHFKAYRIVLLVVVWFS